MYLSLVLFTTLLSSIFYSCNDKEVFNELKKEFTNSDYLHSGSCSSTGFTSIEIPDSLLSPENYEGDYECEIFPITITNSTSNRTETYDVLLEVDENGKLSYIGFEDEMMTTEGFTSSVLIENEENGDRPTLNECLRGCQEKPFAGCKWSCFGDYLVDILGAIMPL